VYTLQLTNADRHISSIPNSQQVDLPIFAIHGNHDDPTRDGGTEMLSALDLLSVSNLINYFGRQDQVDDVNISPVLLQKGHTKVALYGMGSMRDERLNRMWQSKSVRFLKPEDETVDRGDDEEEEGERSNWFNIFTLHQNRDLGRGSKNCVHESMIPEWMDLVVWGHEHECLITPSESLVGTFRITQPGSSVATSLTMGEARRKQVGILDIRGQQFRLKPVPLGSVRSFALGDASLNEWVDSGALDREDPKVEEKMTNMLAAEVEKLVRCNFVCLYIYYCCLGF
jgi:double-strand break repair protein MRE11